MSELPAGWELCQLEDCVEILDSLRKPINNKERNSRIQGKKINELYSYFGATGQVGYIDDYLFSEELVALGEDAAPFLDAFKDKAYILNGKTWVNNHAHVLKGSIGVSNKYICHYLNQFNYHGYVNGATRLKLTQASMRQMPVILAPSSEQTRIANKLDSLIAKVEAAQTHLEKIPIILKRFRQSVLAAATSGEVTKEWREERSISLEGWVDYSLGDLALVQTGSTPLKNEKSYYVGGTIPWLTSTVTSKRVVLHSDNFVTEKAVKECRLKIFKPGTLLIAMYGEGKTRGQVTEISIEAAINQACAAVIVDEEKAYRDYIRLCIQSNYEKTRMMAEGGNQPNLNLSKVRSIPILLPSENEQIEIIRRVESLFVLVDTVEKQFNEAKASADKLTKSILTKAFKGDLVPQDPNDEPAEKLLERIKLLREQESQTIPKKQRAKTKPKTKQVITMKLDDAPTDYLTSLIKKQKEKIHADQLWRLSDMSIDDFYEKLRQEEEANLLTESVDDPKDRMTENRYLIAC